MISELAQDFVLARIVDMRGVDLNPRLSSTDTGSVCLNGASSAASDASQPWLQFNWSGGAAFDQNPAGRAAFGLSRKPAELIYFREMY